VSAESVSTDSEAIKERLGKLEPEAAANERAAFQS
jgi:hypothetical protein